MPHLKVTDSATGQDRTVHYEHHQSTSPKPTVIMAHGWGMSTRVWDDTTAWLTDQGWPVVTFDQRNCGQSDKDFGDVSIEALAADLVAIASQLKLTSVVLNGWSLGGAVVVAAAPLLGESLRGLISTCGATPRYTQAKGFPHGGTEADVAATVTALRADRVNFLQGLYSEGAFAMPVSDAIKSWAYAIALQASPAADASLGALAHVDQRDILQALSVPALFVTGTADGVVDPAIGEFAANLCGNGQHVSIKGSGHTPFIEAPVAYREAVGSFLTVVDANQTNQASN